MKGNLNAAAYRDILGSNVLPTNWFSCTEHWPLLHLTTCVMNSSTNCEWSFVGNIVAEPHQCSRSRARKLSVCSQVLRCCSESSQRTNIHFYTFGMSCSITNYILLLATLCIILVHLPPCWNNTIRAAAILCTVFFAVVWERKNSKSSGSNQDLVLE